MHATPDEPFVYVPHQGTEAKPNDTVSVIDVASTVSLISVKDQAVLKSYAVGKGRTGSRSRPRSRQRRSGGADQSHPRPRQGVARAHGNCKTQVVDLPANCLDTTTITPSSAPSAVFQPDLVGVDGHTPLGRAIR
ncbi:hypothetical protein [Mesorhizobium sp.]|uniref:hypothetical protein n=1 Tax=Mesorhizobium sp. TaxID=1871066 RepID=UPI000FE2BF58|nr:hypothetical protein [Mesorhizobium sp.]RWG81690.1 MAG: hypothetical protein EOQ69_17710 [Mesorhizobium sp.]RWG83959.1 MAG: hypothetical protein EOQ70_20010 [Mesorhizobium sp.]RWK08273.1 MAG: hypothetical protein EOR39_20490 [Mesorhizobium sp.]RWK16383.1 MAG: hypothetical protein EOR41_20480 [Mesorhizobium sp.]